MASCRVVAPGRTGRDTAHALDEGSAGPCPARGRQRPHQLTECPHSPCSTRVDGVDGFGDAADEVGIRPFSALLMKNERGAYALSREYAPRNRWSWGESNPRPSVGERDRYDHSRLRASRWLTGGSVARHEWRATDRLSELSAVFLAVSGLSHRHPSLLLPGCDGLAPCGIAAHDVSLIT